MRFKGNRHDTKLSPDSFARIFPSIARAINSGSAAKENDMAKRKSDSGDAGDFLEPDPERSPIATLPADAEPNEQGVFFPELDDTAEHKAILSLTKKLIKIKDERKEALTESKTQEDKIQSDLVAKMHAAGIKQFRYKGVEAKIKANSEKVKAKFVVDEPSESE